MKKIIFKAPMFIDNVFGLCPSCNEPSILVAIISSYYKCINCGEDTKQYINGEIKYITLSDFDKKWIKNNLKSG